MLVKFCLEHVFYLGINLKKTTRLSRFGIFQTIRNNNGVEKIWL